jgi:hypothetical protein
MKEGQCLSPRVTPVPGDEDVVPVRSIAWGVSHSGGGETPMERLTCN